MFSFFQDLPVFDRIGAKAGREIKIKLKERFKKVIDVHTEDLVQVTAKACVPEPVRSLIIGTYFSSWYHS